ncbi:peptidylprolyl isomerase [Tumebacillus flagellatus]|uniref:Peptidyl-prolyl cis-trans isomerase n=1 Tax=Tumebacillus flagellatus TaxID=1157490 RepID=A0A074LFS1_9BACL|nr:peptidylprolyl isomerase [Tumebacillus flagellatus]KEO81086.1 peptidylprolyl isomerase [Tumebacillus flagellatus]
MKKRNWTSALLCTALAATLLAGCSRDDSSAAPTTPAPAKQDNSTTTTPAKDSGSADTASKNNKYSQAPAMTIDKSKKYTATLKTNKGDIKINLFADKAPLTVNNFVFLAKDHFYDGIKFHRIVQTFMIQTGDPLGTGVGGPGYEFKDELPPAKPYAAGIVAMANRGPDTNGSQFFIGSGDDVAGLNRQPNYTVFGEVDPASMDVVKAIAATPVGPSGNGENSKPKEDVHINSVDIAEQ